MATASANGRTPETVRREIEAEREQLATAVEQLREGDRRGDGRRRASSGRGCPSSPPARSAPASSSRVGSARRCAARPQGPRTLSLAARRGRDRSCARRAPGGSRRASGSTRFKRAFKSFLADDAMGLSAAGRVQLAARVLSRDGLPRRPARPVRRLRRAAGVPRPGRAGRRPDDDRHAAAGRLDGHVRRRVRASAPPARSGRRAAR